MLISSLALVTALVPSVSSAQWTQLGSDIDGEALEDWLGYSVALSSDGSHVAIGAPNGGIGNPGKVRVYRWVSLNWIQVGPDIDGEAESDHSGHSVALSSDGSRVAIGALHNDGNGTDSGHVRVYEWIGAAGNWVQLASDIDGKATGDKSGHSVAFSSDGSRVAVGAPYNDGNGYHSGHVQVYRWVNLNWVPVGLDIEGEASEDLSGSSVALSSDGSRVAIGAPSNDGNGTDSGHVRVYSWNKWTSSWLHVGPDIDGEAANDGSGFSVALSSDGSRVAIGAPANDSNGTDSGHVRVHEYVSAAGNWVRIGSDIDGEAVDDRSGCSVALSSDGSRVAIGAMGNDGNGTQSGHVRVYQWLSPNWVQVGSDIDGEAEGNWSGFDVALSSDGSRVAIGAPDNDDVSNNSGHVRVYSIGIFADGFESGDSARWSSTVP